MATTIGVIGGSEVNLTMRFLNEIYANSDRKPEINNVGGNLKCMSKPYDIVIINSDKSLEEKINQINFTESQVIIINADCKNIFNQIYCTGKKIKGRLITYGFNSKSCVTASSVAIPGLTDDNTNKMLCYIQRRIPTFTGKLLDEQEFPVDVGYRYPRADIVLAAVTAALVDGIGVENISN